MSSVRLIAGVVLIAFLGITSAQDKCGINEHFKQCGPGCESTCKDPNPGVVCKLACKPGCFCKAGYIRNDKGECVRDCACKEYDEVWKWCGICEPTCEDRLPKCSVGCKVAGCYCGVGLVRNSLGYCVAPSECPAACGPNEIWNSCALPLPCQNTCSAPQKQSVCEGSCRPGCVCAAGFVRNGAGACVSSAQCGAAA